MKRLRLYLLLFAVLAVVSLLGWKVYSAEQKPNATVWEYKVVSFLGDNPAQLSELGAQGWELTCVRTEEQVLANFHQTKVYYYLKRAQGARK